MRSPRFVRSCSFVLTVFLLEPRLVEVKEIERFIKMTAHDGEPVTDLGTDDCTIETHGKSIAAIYA